MGDLEGRISTIDFRSPSLSASGDEAGSPVPEARGGSVLRCPILTSRLEGR